MLKRCVAICAALSVYVGAALAQDVTLKSQDGAVEIVGTLLGFDGEFYRVQTVYGELTVDGSGVTCDGPGCPNLTSFVAEISISGSESMAEILMPALLEAFALRNGFDITRQEISENRFELHLAQQDSGELRARFRFHASNADEGFADLLADEADIAMSLREIRDSEAARGFEAGLGDMSDANRSRVLALDGMVPIVSASNPVTAISLSQLAEVFSGKIRNWKELGGADAEISLHMISSTSGFSQALEDQLLSRANLDPDTETVRHGKNAELIRAVERDPFAVGISSFSDIGATKPLTLMGSCGFSLEASRRNIKTEDYPLNAPMFLYFPARRLPKLARDFLAYTRGPSAQVVMRRAGFVDQTSEEIAIDMQGNRLANAISVVGDDLSFEDTQEMMGTLLGKKRLTTSFRFQTGSSRLDAQSRSNVHQLARALESGRYDARTLYFVGFSDGEGPAKINRNIALKRAEAVRDAVVKAAETANPDQLSLEVVAFGEAMPMACDDTSWGRQVNRRVEIWVE